MNKEVIKKYKDVFDYWLDGGKVLFKWEKNKDTQWLEADIHHEWRWSSNIYVQDDQYAEFRKALADGKEIQEWVIHEPPIGGHQGYWANDQIIAFDKAPQCYRIKPDEPKTVLFKVGDWVTSTVTSNTGKVLKFGITDDNVNWLSTYHETLYYELGECILWQPKVGEWCWFWYTNCNPILAKYINSDNEDDEEEYIAEVYTNDRSGNGFTRKDYYTNCEPFIGTLPSFLHD